MLSRYIILFIVCILLLVGHAQNRKITIAVIKDGPSSEESLIGLIDDELKKLTKGSIQVNFKTDPGFNDMILAIGSLVTQEAAKKDLLLTKPFVSTYVQRADITGITYEDDQTLKDNFSMIVIPQRTEGDIRAFRQLIPFQKLHIGISAAEQALMSDKRTGIKQYETGIKQYEDSLGIQLVLVPISDDIVGSLADLDSTSEAFFLTRIPHLTKSQRNDLIQELNFKKIPSFSLLGYKDVELGVLAALAPNITEQIVRRVALNLHRLIRGESTDDLAVTLTVDSRMLINARTAGTIGYIPGAETKVMANFLYEEALKSDLPSQMPKWRPHLMIS
jgi:ABC-type uncharacterized transport system substrate-binding protein